MGWVSGQSLALFTGLAASAAIAYLALAIVLLIGRRVAQDRRALLLKLLGIPLALCWAGLFAAASHLGTPANALYAFTGVGRSPLSNEVVAVVVFLFFAGIIWLYSFNREPSRVLVDAGLAVAGLSCIALVWLMGIAYDVDTVPTWQSPLVPWNLILGALCAGLSLAALLLHVARYGTTRIQMGMLAGSAVALAVGSASHAAYAQYVSGIGNYIVAAGEVGGSFPAMIVAHAALALAGLALQVLARRQAAGSAAAGAVKSSSAGSTRPRLTACGIDAIGAALVLASTVLMRFPFYDAYLSVGF